MSRIRVGKPQIAPDAPAHLDGVPQGNSGPTEAQPGHNVDGTATARRSTGINAKKRNPILTIMPNLPPG